MSAFARNGYQRVSTTTQPGDSKARPRAKNGDIKTFCR